MEILNFKNHNYNIIKQVDFTQRDIGYSKYKNVIITGRNYYNPNVLFYNGHIISPYDEKVMSLNKDTFYDNNIYEFDIKELEKEHNIIREPVFFFIYNFDNYYHFLYDTLPYLYTFLYLKKQYPPLKLLVNYPNKFKKEFYKFNIDFLEKIINQDDWIIHDKKNKYLNIYVSSSLTHGGFSNNPPRNEIFEIYNLIKSKINLTNNINLPKKIYISRRTWINKDKSNIGTDYTTRRKMINEDKLVNELTKLGFVEIFAENLSTDEKIKLFSNVEIVIGSIGGGMANLLFCDKKTKSIIIVTPYFLEINYRFKYSLELSNCIYFDDVKTYTEDNLIPLFCRVKINSTDKIGEIIEYSNNKYLINISDNDIVGFNNNLKYKNEWVSEKDFTLIDNGLNSPYIVNIDDLIKKL
jgi:hypothetical protein